ncbi:MAG: hypothetical protein HY286_07645 [Planctomycetes bacterium]|nr:hypothetical protein [Planctomycetota bacterium]
MKQQHSFLVNLVPFVGAFAGVATLFAPATYAQATAGPKPFSQIDHEGVQANLAARHGGYQSFIKDVGGAWSARFNESTGAPSLIWGEGIPVAYNGIKSMDAARVAAETTLARFPQLWGAPLSQFTLESSYKQGHLYIFTWKQTWDGLDVRRARIQIQVHEAGRIAALVAEGVAIPDSFSRKPELGPENAEAIVKKGKRLATADTVDAVDFLIFVKSENGRAEPRLAYRVDVNQTSANVYEKVYVDAMDGSILEVEPGRYYDVKGQVTGTLNTSLSGIAAPTANTPIPNIKVTISGVGTATTDANGNYQIATALPGPFSVSAGMSGPNFNVSNNAGANISASATTALSGGFQVGNLNFNTSPTEQQTAQTTAALAHTIVLNYAQSKIPSFGGYASQGVNVNLNSTCNAYFDPGGNTINFYSSGGGCVNTAFSTVIYHEFGHGVDDYFGGIANGALSEAIGDIFSMYTTGQAINGQDFFGAGSFIRTGENNTSWPASSCGGEVHCVGETFMGFAWQAYKLLKTSLGATAGIQAAENAFLSIMPPNPSSIPNAVTQVFIDDDDDGNLNNGTPHYNDLAAAAVMKGFTPPAVQILSIIHTPHPDTFNQSLAYAIYSNISAVAGHTVASAFVDYNVNGGATQSIAMSLIDGYYIGNIPPVAGPAVISYKIRANDNLNNTLAVPSGDDAYRFAIGKKTDLFSSDMESGSTGWTHVQVKTQDDWNWGKPQTLGSNSYDPKTAFSGINCWGNDLQNSTASQDGLYKDNVENYLETPNINSTGFTGVHVRFRRWLTVESGQFDQAQVLVNGSTVYSNPQLTDQIDSTWTLQDHAASSGDNNAAFRARWRLKSDAGVHFGGWTIDDVLVYALQATPVLNMNLAVNSSTILIGNNLVFNLNGTPNANWDLYASLDAGPGTLDGFGVIGCGLNTLSYFTSGTMTPAGTAQLVFPIPYEPALDGIKIYWVGGASASGALTQISNTVSTTFQQFP